MYLGLGPWALGLPSQNLSLGSSPSYVADTQLYMRLSQTDAPSVRTSVVVEKKSGKNNCFRNYFCMFESGGVVVEVWIGVGCPCPPVRDDFVTPRRLFSLIPLSTVFLIVCELRIDIPLPDYTTALFTTSYNQRNLVPDIFYAILNGTDKSRWSENGHIGKMLSMLSRKCNVAM